MTLYLNSLALGDFASRKQRGGHRIVNRGTTTVQPYMIGRKHTELSIEFSTRTYQATVQALLALKDTEEVVFIRDTEVALYNDQLGTWATLDSIEPKNVLLDQGDITLNLTVTTDHTDSTFSASATGTIADSTPSGQFTVNGIGLGWLLTHSAKASQTTVKQSLPYGLVQAFFNGRQPTTLSIELFTDKYNSTVKRLDAKIQAEKVLYFKDAGSAILGNKPGVWALVESYEASSDFRDTGKLSLSLLCSTWRDSNYPAGLCPPFLPGPTRKPSEG